MQSKIPGSPVTPQWVTNIRAACPAMAPRTMEKLSPIPAMTGIMRDKTKKEFRDTRLTISRRNKKGFIPERKSPNKYYTINMMVTMLLVVKVLRLCEDIRLRINSGVLVLVFIVVTTSHLGQSIENNAVLDDFTDNLSHDRPLRCKGVGLQYGNKLDTLEKSRPNYHMGNRRFLDGCTADENRGHSHKRHEHRTFIKLDKTIALGVDQNAGGAQDRRQGGANDAVFIDINSGSSGKTGIVTRGTHGDSGFAAHKKPHKKGTEGKKQQ